MKEFPFSPPPTNPAGLRNKDYNKVEDLYDTRVPLHNEDAFSHGLRFKAKVSGQRAMDAIVIAIYVTMQGVTLAVELKQYICMHIIIGMYIYICIYTSLCVCV